MKLIEFISALAIGGTLLVWLACLITLIAGIFTPVSNKRFGNVLFYVFAATYVVGIALIIIEKQYANFWWWMFAVLSPLALFISISFIEKFLKNHRCPECKAWKVVSHNAEDATYTTTYKYVSDGKYKGSHTKLDKLRKRVWLCKCKKCGFIYEWWEEGGDMDPVAIDEERFQKTTDYSIKTDK